MEPIRIVGHYHTLKRFQHTPGERGVYALRSLNRFSGKKEDGFRLFGAEWNGRNLLFELPLPLDKRSSHQRVACRQLSHSPGVRQLCLQLFSQGSGCHRLDLLQFQLRQNIFGIRVEVNPEHSFPNPLSIVREKERPIPRNLDGLDRAEPSIKGEMIQSKRSLGFTPANECWKPCGQIDLKRLVIPPIDGHDVQIARRTPLPQLDILKETPVEPLETLPQTFRPKAGSELKKAIKNLHPCGTCRELLNEVHRCTRIRRQIFRTRRISKMRRQHEIMIKIRNRHAG